MFFCASSRPGPYWAGCSSEQWGHPANERRVVRGGSWNNIQGRARLGYRNHNDPDNRNNNLGFRLCRASHIFPRLQRLFVWVAGGGFRGGANRPCASKSTSRPRLGVEAQLV
ncbi:MAG: SUMF1/EgtB/PvdO family nonheme iron enzyme [Sedimenticola sp.]